MGRKSGKSTLGIIGRADEIGLDWISDISTHGSIVR